MPMPRGLVVIEGLEHTVEPFRIQPRTGIRLCDHHPACRVSVGGDQQLSRPPRRAQPDANVRVNGEQALLASTCVTPSNGSFVAGHEDDKRIVNCSYEAREATYDGGTDAGRTGVLGVYR